MSRSRRYLLGISLSFAFAFVSLARTGQVLAWESLPADPDTQGTSSADFEIFNSLVAAIESCKLGQASAYTLDNY